MKTAFAHLGVLAALIIAAPALAADTSLGRRDYEHNCAMCHGLTGKGDGWLAQHLVVPIPSITLLKKDNGGVFPRARAYEVIDGTREVTLHGSRVMPVWGRTFLLDEMQRGFGEARGQTRAPEEAVRARIFSLIDYISQLQE